MDRNDNGIVGGGSGGVSNSTTNGGGIIGGSAGGGGGGNCIGGNSGSPLNSSSTLGSLYNTNSGVDSQVCFVVYIILELGDAHIYVHLSATWFIFSKFLLKKPDHLEIENISTVVWILKDYHHTQPA